LRDKYINFDVLFKGILTFQMWENIRPKTTVPHPIDRNGDSGQVRAQFISRATLMSRNGHHKFRLASLRLLETPFIAHGDMIDAKDDLRSPDVVQNYWRMLLMPYWCRMGDL